MRNFTINRLLEVEELSGIKLVYASKKSQENIITNVNLIENPESYEWFSSGEFILTTGYFFRDDEQKQIHLIRKLHELGCSGIGIKINRYWEKTPNIILKEAKRLDFPIIEIPFKYSLTKINTVINNYIFNSEEILVKNYLDIRYMYLKMGFGATNIENVVNFTSDLIGNPLILLDSEFNLIYYHDLDGNPKNLESIFRLVKREPVFNRELIDTIPRDVEKLTVNILRDVDDITVRFFPIYYLSTIYGYLVLINSMRSLKSIDYLAIENATNLIAVEREKTRQIEESKNRLREDFFDDLIQNKIESVNALKNLARLYGLNPKNDHIISIIRFKEIDEKSFKLLSENIINMCGDSIKNIEAILRDLNVILFIEVSKHTNTCELKRRIKIFTQDISKWVEANIGDDFIMSISNLCVDFSNISKSISVAQEIIEIALNKNSKNKIYYFDDYLSYYFLDHFVQRKSLREFYDMAFKDLLELENNENSDLIETLEAYFNFQGNISRAAKSIFLHRNTFIYRLEKIQKLLNFSIENDEACFNIQLALKIRRILGL